MDKFLAKFLSLFVLFYVFLTGLDFLLHAFNYPWFPGQAYGALVAIMVLCFIVAKTAVKIALYQPKPKEGSKP